MRRSHWRKNWKVEEEGAGDHDQQHHVGARRRDDEATVVKRSAGAASRYANSSSRQQKPSTSSSVMSIANSSNHSQHNQRPLSPIKIPTIAPLKMPTISPPGIQLASSNSVSPAVSPLRSPSAGQPSTSASAQTAAELQASSRNIRATHSNNSSMRRGKPNKKQQKPWPNVGSTVAALAAVLAAAPTAVQSPAERQRYLDSRQHDRPGLLAVPSPGGGPGSVSPRSACSSPALPSARRPLCSPVSLSAAPSPAMAPSPGSAPAPSSTSPLQSLRHEFRSFKRRSISEISLVLELVRGVARARWAFDEEEDEEELDADSDPEGPAGSGGRRFYTLSPAESQGNSLFGGGGGSGGFHRGGAQSTGNLLSRQGTQRRRQALRRKIQWEQLSPAAIQRHLVQVQEEKAMLQAPTAPIDAPKFVAYVQERRKKRILFKGEFLMIQRSVDPQKVGTEVAIRMGEKNQYPDTLPYDHNRVVLEPRAGIDDSHYINASYVNSWLREKAYVVTQSVRNKQASNELWRCIWELGSNTIVMLTKIFDFMRVVCLQYWPQTQFQFGEIHVETLETRTYAHFVIRTFRLRKTGGLGELAAAQQDQQGNPIEERIVKHFHFTEWELNSFPYISAFVELRRRVRQWTEKNPVDGPIVVHCSNGGGRSGAFLAVDASLELLQRTGQLDVYEYGRTMANARQHLISSVEQYMFIYDVLCEAVLCNLQPMAMHQLKERSSMYKARKDRELMELQDSHENKLLTMLTAPLRIGDCAGGHRLENRGKNRDVMVVPPDHARPYLQTLHGESKDYTYINAVEVDGFTRKAEFIVTEWPKQQTLDSFWTLIFDHNVHTVICLTNQPNDMKVYPPFVHNKGKKNYGPFTIEIVNFQQYPGLCSHMVKISKRPTCAPVPSLSPANLEKPGGNKKLTFMISEIMATGASQQQLEAEVRLCCIIQVRMWPIENKVPLSTTALIEVLKMTRSWRKRAPDRPESRPTIVMSHNGVSRCGIFIAANVCIDQMEMDHEVDVFHAVKLIRINRPQLIDMKDEYKYLYDLMLHWYMTNPELRSHEPPEVVSLNSEESEEDLLSAGKLTRSGSRRRSIQRSKSSRASRRTQRTANSTTLSPNSNAADGTAANNNKLARNSSSVSAGALIEPVFLN